MKSFSYPLYTRYAETAQDKIIHHSAYPVYMEVARVEFFKTLGCDINELEKENIYCPVTELSIKYLKPLYSLEEIEVIVLVTHLTKVRFSLAYQIFRGKELTTEGTTVHCFLNQKLRPIPIPKVFLEPLQDLKVDL